ncbi:MAG: kelch repeat-containing protein [Kofleriaceae bacterium]
MRRWLLLLTLTGCLHDELVRCADGRACPAGTACDLAHQSCVDPAQLAACDGTPDETACDAVADGVCFDGVCIASGCGNSEVEVSSGEQCDDGNNANGDGCSADCRSTERCGNGVVDPGEACDDGNARSHDGCASQCLVEEPVWLQAPAAVFGRTRGAAAYDAARGQFIVVGGRSNSSGYIGNTLVWRDGTWAGAMVDPVVQPSPSENAGMVFDAARGEIVLFGGFNGTPIADTWIWDGERWQVRDTPNRPPARSRHAMAYDPVRRQVVMFGGARSGEGVPQYLDDTWVWDGIRWQQIVTQGPSPRADHSMAFDPIRGELVLFGGEVAIDTQPIPGGFTQFTGVTKADTWRWTGETWELLSPSTAATTGRGRMALFWTGTTIVSVGGWRYSRTTGMVPLPGGYSPTTEDWVLRWDPDLQTWSPVTDVNLPIDRALPTAKAADTRGRLLVLASGLTSLRSGDGTWELAPGQANLGGREA